MSELIDIYFDLDFVLLLRPVINDFIFINIFYFKRINLFCMPVLWIKRGIGSIFKRNMSEKTLHFSN